MLELPSGGGFSQSVNVNNVDTRALADWIESSALFGGATVSKSDVADILVEQHVAGSQDMAYEIADAGWMEIDSRFKQSGPSDVLALGEHELIALGAWQQDVARSFMLALSIMGSFPEWAARNRHTPSQGELFERLSAEACAHLFVGWQVERAGWSGAAPRAVPELVSDLSDLLGTDGHADPAIWAGQSANDAGLDLLCYRTFNDRRECVPFFMLQCASGANWTTKLAQPAKNLWQKLLDASFEPVRAMTIPFVVSHQEMKQRCIVIEGPLFDRLRLMNVPGGSSSWVSAQLAADLEVWLEPRLADLPWS